MRRGAPLLLVALVVAACGSNNASRPRASGTHVAQAAASATPVQARSTPGRSRSTGPVAPPPTPVISTSYAAFVADTCHALAAADATTIGNELPYYQYNSGVRYGVLGDGEGQTGDPGVLSTWLQGAAVRCWYYTPDVAGHGTLLTSGWKQPGGWSLMEFDTFNGIWKINDFTFGDRAALYQAMQTSQPILPYHGR